ncbi:uncharacterized protein LOC136081119 [Hydra vulgaris]|uniref:Uncharacterized protein LOC136081119 n=1 Tax=Hydra vulgaris TaxID=6087 RepID=A0ABM4BZ07_HYDVU
MNLKLNGNGFNKWKNLTEALKIHENSLGLTEIIIGALKDFGLNISFCRGQGYDNGANIKGKKIGLQKRILDLNPLAFYLPCESHSLNLVIRDAAQSSLNSINVFGIIQRLFTLFSASTSRWNVLLSRTTNFTLKRLCDTRWEAKIESLKAIRYQISSVHNALITIYETETKTPDIAHEAQTLAEQLKDIPLKRVRRVKRHYDENAADEPIQNPEKKLEVTFFNRLLDTCLSSINERFEQINEYVNIWNKLSKVESEINTKEMTPLFVLNFIKKHCLQELYSNTWIVLCILLTIPVTVPSGERSFSKLKLTKRYLRDTMLQDRLNSLSMLSIEQEITENLDFSS